MVDGDVCKNLMVSALNEQIYDEFLHRNRPIFVVEFIE